MRLEGIQQRDDFLVQRVPQIRTTTCVLVFTFLAALVVEGDLVRVLLPFQPRLRLRDALLRPPEAHLRLRAPLICPCTEELPSGFVPSQPAPPQFYSRRSRVPGLLGDARLGPELEVVGSDDGADLERRHERRRRRRLWRCDVLFIVVASLVLLLGGEARLALDVLSHSYRLALSE